MPSCALRPASCLTAASWLCTRAAGGPPRPPRAASRSSRAARCATNSTRDVRRPRPVPRSVVAPRATPKTRTGRHRTAYAPVGPRQKIPTSAASNNAPEGHFRVAVRADIFIDQRQGRRRLGTRVRGGRNESVEELYHSAGGALDPPVMCAVSFALPGRHSSCTDGARPWIAPKPRCDKDRNDMMTTTPRSEGQQPRHVVIIARHYAALFEYVRGRFAKEGNIEVILDRRSGRDRRRRTGDIANERRTRDRRRRPHVDDALRIESMQFVTIC